MLSCIKVDPDYENELRALCLEEILENLKISILLNKPHEKFSRLSNLEQNLIFPTPIQKEDLSDFAVILGLGFLTIGMQFCSYYMKWCTELIPLELLKSTTTLLYYVWLFRWKYL
jgi:hypothetical protein